MLTLKTVFEYLKIDTPLSPYTRKYSCPFPNHPKDNTPSFHYYPDKDSFYCWGCRLGGEPFQFAFYYLTQVDPEITYEQVYELFYEKPEEMLYDSLLASLSELNTVQEYNFIQFDYRCSRLLGIYLRNNKHDLDFCESVYLNIDRIIAQRDSTLAEEYLVKIPRILKKRDKSTSREV